MPELDIDTALAQLEAHEAAVRTTPDATHDDDDTGLLKDINNVFANVEQQQRLDKGRATLTIRSYAA